MTPEERFVSLLANDIPKKSDAIVVLEGDGLKRLEEGVRLFREGSAPLVVLSGGLQKTGSISAEELAPLGVAAGIPKGALILETESLNTREQALAVTKIASQRGWKSLLIVASRGHHVRAFLTFLKALKEAELENILLTVVSAPGPHDLLSNELAKIKEYQAQGDVASYEDGLRYLAMRNV